MQPAPVMIQQQPTVMAAPSRTVRIKATRVLGILQIVIGAISIIFGIAAVALGLKNKASRDDGFGIMGGLWILIGGIIGVCSASNPTNKCLNGTNMAFGIISCIISSVLGIVYSTTIDYYSTSYCGYEYSYFRSFSYYTCRQRKNSAIAMAIYASLIVSMVAEFCIALTVSIYGCKYGCSCCNDETRGIIVHPAQPHGVAYSNQPAVASFPATAGYAHSSYPSQQGQMVTYTTMAPTTGYAQPPNPNAMTYSQPINQSVDAQKAFAPDAAPH